MVLDAEQRIKKAISLYETDSINNITEFIILKFFLDDQGCIISTTLDKLNRSDKKKLLRIISELDSNLLFDFGITEKVKYVLKEHDPIRFWVKKSINPLIIFFSFYSFLSLSFSRFYCFSSHNFLVLL